MVEHGESCPEAQHFILCSIQGSRNTANQSFLKVFSPPNVKEETREDGVISSVSTEVLFLSIKVCLPMVIQPLIIIYFRIIQMLPVFSC